MIFGHKLCRFAVKSYIITIAAFRFTFAGRNNNLEVIAKSAAVFLLVLLITLKIFTQVNSSLSSFTLVVVHYSSVLVQSDTNHPFFQVLSLRISMLCLFMLVININITYD